MRFLLGTLLVIALLLAAAWFLQRKLIYFPDRAAPPPAAGVRDVTLTTADGLRLSAWLVPPPSGTPDRRTGVLVAAGNAGNRADRLPLAHALARHGLTVLLADYRGYGGNPGEPTERGLAHDIRAARDHLAGRGFDRIFYYGESLGCAVATALAAEHPPAGLILRSPFTDLASAGKEHYPFLPVRLLARDRFPVAGLISGISVPTLVVYGTADSIVPAAQSRAVAEAAAGPVRVVAVEGADHNDASLLAGDQLIAAVLDFVQA